MARYTGPKFKLDRREGTNLFLKGKRSLSGKHPLDKKGAVPPGRSAGRFKRRRISDYALQLREKQKVKRMYGLLERQFKRYFEIASKEKGNRGTKLLEILESRLDNIVYRLGFASSRAQSRQLVSHGHILVNDKKIDIPSYNVKVGDIISLTGAAQKFPLVAEALDLVGQNLPKWLKREGLSGKVLRMTEREELDASINEALIVEYYSR